MYFDLIVIEWQIPIKAPGRARGELEITYLDEELRLVYVLCVVIHGFLNF